MITETEVKARIVDSPAFAIKCLKVLYARQTRSEQQSEQTREYNGVGFNGVDASILTSFAKHVEMREAEPVQKYPLPLSPRQLDLLQSKLLKYSAQLVDHFNNNGGIE